MPVSVLQVASGLSVTKTSTRGRRYGEAGGTRSRLVKWRTGIDGGRKSSSRCLAVVPDHPGSAFLGYDGDRFTLETCEMCRYSESEL